MESADEDLEVELEVTTGDLDAESVDVVDDLDDPWFASESSAANDVYEIDPVHPLRRLSVWVRGRIAA
ncbi:MAG TPA: hypothetical protein VLT45_03120 [Kofleriaceae bacterium]|nr:hypothetical protein [Kofleriaceae bacterium]